MRIRGIAFLCLGWTAAALAGQPELGQGTYAPIEAACELPELSGNPFDYAENNVMVQVACPDLTTASVPAFFDGGSTWRVRYTPRLPGRYVIQQVTLNGKSVELAKPSPNEFRVTGTPGRGFVRVDPANPRRFVFDSGEPYYPLGYNVGWVSAKGGLPEYITRLGQDGGNWARIWMCHFTQSMNLDWVSGTNLPLGTLSLDVARRWDATVAAASEHGVYLQIALQHHGQYSSQTNPNWSDNPWNKSRGGWLQSPEDFFTDPRAIALTKAKYRYIVARWGYSPHVLAWELFNEVEWTDGMNRKPDTVVQWHREMAALLRQQDPNRHLVTTSSPMQAAALWQDLDYYQPHGYPPEPLGAIARIDNLRLGKPYFFGEIGPGGGRDDGDFLHRALWGSLMSQSSGAAQYWYWDRMQQPAFAQQLRAAARFVSASKMPDQAGLRPASVRVECEAEGPLEIGPGGEWGQGGQTEFTVQPSGEVPGIAEMPRYLHGTGHAELFRGCTFQARYAAPGKFVVHVSQIARAGARLVVSLDGTSAATREFPAGNRDQNVNAAVEIDVPQGNHVLGLSNTGKDWVVLRGFTFDPYLPAVGVLGKASDGYAALWVFNRRADLRSTGVKGRIFLAGMQPGKYRVVWFDTHNGEAMGPEVVSVAPDGAMEISTPAIARDMVAWVSQ